jgi:hypothetical protein
VKQHSVGSARIQRSEAAIAYRAIADHFATFQLETSDLSLWVPEILSR